MTPLTPEAKLRAQYPHKIVRRKLGGAPDDERSHEQVDVCELCGYEADGSEKDDEPCVGHWEAVLDDLARTRERNMDAITDERCVGFYRDMAARFAEDRDVQKHRAREATAETERLLREISALPLTVFAHMDGFVAGEWNCACGSKWMDGEPEQHAPSCLRARALALVTGTEKARTP